MNSCEKVVIVRRDEISVIEQINTPNGVVSIGQLADFRKHFELNRLMPKKAHHVSFAWTSLEPHQTLPMHKHPIDSMIIICEGSGRYFGEFDAVLKAGDIVYVTSNALHGFQANNHGLRCLSVQFEDTGLYSNKNRELVDFSENSPYDNLINLNKQWMARFDELCKELHSDTQQFGSVYVNTLFGLIGRWSHVFQNILFLRQAHSSNKDISRMFKAHLVEEFGHDALIENYHYIWDAQIEGYFSWFLNQMYVLCDSRKLILVHMVLESAGEIFSTQFKKNILGEPNLNQYLDLHYHLDEDHAQIGSEHVLLYSQQNFSLAKETCENGWILFIEMFRRFMIISKESILVNHY